MSREQTLFRATAASNGSSSLGVIGRHDRRQVTSIQVIHAFALARDRAAA